MKHNNPEKISNKLSLVISYLTLRKAIGILGIAFPVVLVSGSIIAGGCEEIQSSISCYYHTNMRNIFVGILCAVALFLFSYRGYERKDNIAGDLACLFALGVAFFPASVDDPLPLCNFPSLIKSPLISYVHFLSAALFFTTLSYFSIILFTKSKSRDSRTKRKKKRNRIYRVCGYIMLGCIILIGVYFLPLKNRYPQLQNIKPVFWLESIALWAFGISWLVKGEVLLKDMVNK